MDVLISGKVAMVCGFGDVGKVLQSHSSMRKPVYSYLRLTLYAPYKPAWLVSK